MLMPTKPVSLIVTLSTGAAPAPDPTKKRYALAFRPLGTVEIESRTGPSVQASESLLAAGDLSGVLFGLTGGKFTMSEVVHMGETRGRSWYSKVTCHPFVTGTPNA